MARHTLQRTATAFATCNVGASYVPFAGLGCARSVPHAPEQHKHVMRAEPRAEAAGRRAVEHEPGVRRRQRREARAAAPRARLRSGQLVR
jgi:hypothetical protein